MMRRTTAAAMIIAFRAKNKGKGRFLPGFTNLFVIKKAKQPTIKKRNSELRNISAGDLVKFPSEMKLALVGEKKDED